MKRTRSMITTTDNPYDPFTQFDAWFNFDNDKGYCSCAYLARIAKVSDDLSDIDQEQAIDLAVDEIISLNVLGIYKKASQEIESDQ